MDYFQCIIWFLFEALILWYYLIIIIREYFWWTDSYYEKCTIENLMREKNQSCITGITKKDLSLILRSTLLFSDKSKWEEIQIYSFELNFLTLNRELPAMKCSMLNKKPLFMSWWRSFFIEMNNWALCIRLIWHIGMYYINNRIFFFCSEFRCIDIMRYVVL